MTVSLHRRWRFSATRLLLTCLLAIAALLLSGCVRYDVGINFQGQFRGAIVQHIRLSEQLASFNQLEAQRWLESFDRRAGKLQGNAKHLSDREILVTIPFANGDELVEKFNRFFNTAEPPDAKKVESARLSPVPVQSQLFLKQRNWLLFERERLRLTVDLRGLGVTSEEGPLIVSPESLVNLELALNTPWGAKNVAPDAEGASVAPSVRQEGKQLIWQLEPGEVNLLEAVFWVPSNLTWGAIAIAVFVSLGYFFKYKRFPLLER